MRNILMAIVLMTLVGGAYAETAQEQLFGKDAPAFELPKVEMTRDVKVPDSDYVRLEEMYLYRGQDTTLAVVADGTYEGLAVTREFPIFAAMVERSLRIKLIKQCEGSATLCKLTLTAFQDDGQMVTYAGKVSPHPPYKLSPPPVGNWLTIFMYPRKAEGDIVWKVTSCDWDDYTRPVSTYYAQLTPKQ